MRAKRIESGSTPSSSAAASKDGPAMVPYPGLCSSSGKVARESAEEKGGGGGGGGEGGGGGRLKVTIGEREREAERVYLGRGD